jgi:hypothetical protein
VLLVVFYYHLNLFFKSKIEPIAAPAIAPAANSQLLLEQLKKLAK